MWIGLGTFYSQMKHIFIYMMQWMRTIATSGTKKIPIQLPKFFGIIKRLRYAAESMLGVFNCV